MSPCNDYETDYNALVETVLERGKNRSTRAGPTVSQFGTAMRISSLRYGMFPILTQRRIFYKPVLGELAAFLRGAIDLAEFQKFGCNYWNANAMAWSWNKNEPPGKEKVGRIYGAVWRDFNDVDQIQRIVYQIKNEPDSRRILLTAYDPSEEWQCLPPCHILAQFNCNKDNTTDVIVYMRSVDLCLGLPSDVVLYATLLLLVCHATGRLPGDVVFMMGDTHIYTNHIPVWEVHREQMGYELPNYTLNPLTSLSKFVPEDLQLIDYNHGAKLEYPFAT